MGESNNYFPYKPREGQAEFIRFIQSNLEQASHLCIDAPTGYGKTPLILSALLTQDLPIIWAVRTGNETDRPIEELKIINHQTHSKFFGLSYRGKKDMCLLAKELKLEGVGWEDVALLCKLRKDNCPYNFDEFKPADWITEPLLYSEILERCKARSLCPYKIQRELLPYAKIIGLSYNYVLQEGIGWSIRRDLPFESCYLVLDEAHNLQSACSNLNSIQITSGSIAHALEEIKDFKSEKAKLIKELILTLQALLNKEIKLMGSKEESFDPNKFFRELVKKSDIEPEELPAIFLQLQKYGISVRTKQLREGKTPHSSLYHLSNFLKTLLENKDQEGIAFIKTKEKKRWVLEQWDMRSKALLAKKWKNFKQCLFCSGTLSPFRAFAETAGLVEYKSKQFHSPFSKSNVRSLIIKGISTKGEELSKSMVERYLNELKDFLSLDINLAIFSASYRIQNNLIRSGLKELIEAQGKKPFLEYHGMSGDKAREMLQEFKQCGYASKKGVICASASGRFAEGADFPSKELEGIFLVGIPFDRLSLKTKLYLEYYKKIYGKEKGTYYGYVVPALRRASQCLGRSLRSKEDKALLVGGDERYGDNRFFRLLPDYFQKTAELIEFQSFTKIKEEISSMFG
jgi:DNA excision repair protein ERCC-2